jgi:MerR family mercuric resistance operon transcriptional regulator
MKPLSIGQAARLAGVGVETIRFYERQGLIDKPPRRASGYRQYDEGIIARLQFIRRAKNLGFTLHEIQELLSLRVDPMTTCEDVNARAHDKIIDIEERIRQLQRMKKALSKLTKACGARGPISECPILDSLDVGRKSTQSNPVLRPGPYYLQETKDEPSKSLDRDGCTRRRGGSRRGLRRA